MNRRDAVLALVALAAATGSRASLAQQPDKVWRVGFLSPQPRADPAVAQGIEAFLKGMRGLGFVEGKNLVVESRFADGKPERLPGMAAELVQLKVDVVVAAGSPAIGAAQRATTTIPIVMATTGDPVGSGFVKSLARPGGNITGLSNLAGDLGPKLLDLLHTVVPKLSRVVVLVSPASSTSRRLTESILASAKKAGVRALTAQASTPPEIERAFSMMARENADAVIVGTGFSTLQRQQMAELAIKYRLPSIYGNRSSVEAGGLMSYGPDNIDHYRRAATYVDKILKGAKPGDLPVEQPVKIEFVINLKTAKAIGLTIPQTILLRADEVIQW